MKWVKHMTASHDDERMAALLDKGGIEGYGFYWLLLEHVASTVEKGDTNASLTYSLTQWAHRLHSHTNRVSKYLGVLGVVGLVQVEYAEGSVRVSIPNIVKYRDEYSTRKPKCPDTIPTDTCARSEKEVDTEAKEDADTDSCPPDGERESRSPHVSVTTTSGECVEVASRDRLQIVEVTPVFESWFEGEFWATYPRKVKKDAARKAARKFDAHKSEAVRQQIIWGLKRHIPSMEARIEAKGIDFIPYPATWLNGRMWTEEPEVIVYQQRETRADRDTKAFAEAMAYEAELKIRLAQQPEPKRIAQ